MKMISLLKNRKGKRTSDGQKPSHTKYNNRGGERNIIKQKRNIKLV